MAANHSAISCAKHRHTGESTVRGRVGPVIDIGNRIEQCSYHITFTREIFGHARCMGSPRCQYRRIINRGYIDRHRSSNVSQIIATAIILNLEGEGAVGSAVMIGCRVINQRAVGKLRKANRGNACGHGFTGKRQRTVARQSGNQYRKKGIGGTIGSIDRIAEAEITGSKNVRGIFCRGNNAIDAYGRVVGRKYFDVRIGA